MITVKSGTKEYAACRDNPKIILHPIAFERKRNYRFTLSLYITSVKSAIATSKEIVGLDPVATNGFNLVLINGRRRSFNTGSPCFLKTKFVLRAIFAKPTWFYNDVFTYEVIATK